MGLLTAATNHPELLDPAVWRRFDATLSFDLPNEAQRSEAVRRIAGEEIAPELVAAIATIYARQSVSDIERGLARAKRSAVMQRQPLEQAVIALAHGLAGGLPADDRRRLAAQLTRLPGLSQRQISALTGVARDTVRKHANESLKERV